MPLTKGSIDQELLFASLKEAAGAKANWICSVQGGGEHMLVLLSDPVSRNEVWAYAGRPEAIIAAFKGWLLSKI